MRQAMLLLVCLVLVSARSAIGQRTITVGPGRDYATIQAAIDAATTGDTVIVYPGTYVENINFKGKSIILRSTDPTSHAIRGTTIIDGNSSGSVVTLAGTETSGCVLSGFTIQNGRATPSGGGVCGNGAYLLIENCYITNNAATSFDYENGGGGLAYCNGTIQNNTITSNTASNYYANGCDGGGLYKCGGKILNNGISYNRASSGGGLSECNATIQNNTITNNIAWLNGGGLANLSGAIIGNTIFGNSADRGGGLASCNGMIRNNTITANIREGLAACGGTIRCNIVGENTGDGLWLCGVGSIENNLIRGNEGDGLYHCQGPMYNNTIVSNRKYGLRECNKFSGDPIRNCIIWGNWGGQLIDSPSPDYSCIQGGYSGTGNIDSNPIFVDVIGYSLLPNSPCIDAGDPSPEYNDGCRPPGQKTLHNDMGAYGGPQNCWWSGSSFVVLRTPNGGQTLNVGTVQEISWDAASQIQKVDIFLLHRNGGFEVTTIAQAAANTGTTHWTVPNIISNECYIRVADAADANISDASDGPFRIVTESGTIQVLSPNGGEVYFWSDTISIQWTSSGASHWVGIHYTIDGGDTWNLLVAETINDGEYLWPAPHVSSHKCRVSVFDAAPPTSGMPLVYDISDADFWIYQDSAALNPNFRITTADFHPPTPVQMKPGDPLVISALVENLGVNASGPAWLEVWGSRTGGITLDYFLCESVRLDAIPPDGSFSLNTTKPLASIPDGPYTMVYVADRPNEVAESQEWDNRFVVAGKRLLTIRPPTGANLTIDGFQVAPNPLMSFQPINFSGWVRNTGAQDSGPFWIEFWGSMNRIFPQLDFMLCDSICVPNLPAGQSISLGDYQRQLYSCLSGTFMAGVFVDRPDQINETDETDNYSFVDGIGFNQLPIAPPKEWEVHLSIGPDLVVAGGDFSPGGPTPIAPGAPVRISTRVENQGTADTGPFWLEFWGSRLGGLSLDEFLCDSIYVPNIAVGQAFEINQDVPLYSMPDGPYTFTVAADRMGAVADASPRNNRLAVAGKRILTIRPQTQANLRVENFAAATTTLRRGQPLGLSGLVRNTGTQDSGPFWIELWGAFNQMYPDLDFFLCDSINVPNLAAGEALDLAANPRTLYETTPMVPCMILCFPDRPDFVNETDESDNPAAIGGCRIEP